MVTKGPADIITTLAEMVVGFRRLNLNPPESVILKTHDDGMRLVHELHQKACLVLRPGSASLGKPVEHPDGSVWMEVEVYGLKIRWPGNRYAMEAGGYVWT